MACNGCNITIDCPDDPTFPFSLTSGPILPFLLECPAGYDCSQASTVSLLCCNSILTLAVPVGATAEQMSSLLNALVIQCQAINNCGQPLPDPVPPSQASGTGFGSPYSFHANRTTMATSTCPDGTAVAFSVPAGAIAAATSTLANQQASAYAQNQVTLRQVCLGGLPNTNYVGISYVESIQATGSGTIGVASNPWSIIAGSAPSGMTIGTPSAPWNSIPFTGTPTTVGNYSFTVKYSTPAATVTKTYPITVSLIPAPPVPTLTGSAGNAQNVLAWTASSGAVSYSLYRGTTSGSHPTLVVTTSALGFTDTGLTNGTTYYYVVQANGVSQSSANSNEVAETPANASFFFSLVWDYPPYKAFAGAQGTSYYTNSGNQFEIVTNWPGGSGAGPLYANNGYFTYTGPSVSCNLQISISGWIGNSQLIVIYVQDNAAGGAVYSSTKYISDNPPPPGYTFKTNGIYNVAFTIPASTSRVINVYWECDGGFPVGATIIDIKATLTPA